MRLLALLSILCLCAHFSFAQQELSRSPFSIGETLQFQSQILHQERVLNVYLPASYAENTKQSYPVIYLLDGSADEDFVHIAGLVQFGSMSWINLLPESIVVGIGNVDRKHDFTFPTSVKGMKKDFPTSGGSADFIQFISKEVQPMVEKQFRTNGNRSLIGQSLGGLLATEILFDHPNMFDQYFIISPSLWWDKESLLAKQTPSFSGPKFVYIAVGKEGKVMEKDAKALYEKLNQDKSGETNLHFEFFEKQNHGDVLHLAIYHGFEKVFIQE